MIKKLPAFLRPCRVQLFHLGTIAALEPERQAGRIALTVVFRIQHPLAVGPVLDAVQMQQPIEHLCSAAVLFGDLRGCHQRIGIAQVMEEPTQVIEEEEPTEEEKIPFTIAGNGEVEDNIVDDPSKEFFTVKTKGGNTFFLVIDRARNSENVYMLSMIDEYDLQELWSHSRIC